MTQATTIKFGAIIVAVGNGASPEIFAEPCGFTSKSWSLTKDLATTNVPDCDDPDSASWIERDIVARHASISGDGVMARESYPTWRMAYENNSSINCRITVEGTPGGYWAGKFHLTSMEFRGARGSRVTNTIRMDNDGAVTWVPVP